MFEKVGTIEVENSERRHQLEIIAIVFEIQIKNISNPQSIKWG